MMISKIATSELCGCKYPLQNGGKHYFVERGGLYYKVYMNPNICNTEDQSKTKTPESHKRMHSLNYCWVEDSGIANLVELPKQTNEMNEKFGTAFAGQNGTNYIDDCYCDSEDDCCSYTITSIAAQKKYR
ncbi:hypothetical protein DdX_19627 [Ditylenchus destructor]|uniref:Uncharacterized protein n=1 Tax=Ditylenchus destructor TaxID=166010 RepID=A0AAD4QS85_9BILA|nr:hypothetical protein DdX_19627 [Ditylenchus destructor]